MIIEAFGRLLAGLALVGAGAGVTGAYLGTPLSMLACATVLAFILRRHLGTPDLTSPPHPLTALARDARYPIAGLAIVALLQNADVIMAKHQLSDDDAGVYAAAAVAGKAVVWIAVGVGLYLLPEATRRAAAGLDPRKALARALIIIGVIALPALALFAGVPGLLLELAFGPEYRRGDDILLLIGIGFAALATTYLAVQYLLGLGWRAFMLPLAVAAAVEPAILLSADDLISFARTLLIVQAGRRGRRDGDLRARQGTAGGNDLSSTTGSRSIDLEQLAPRTLLRPLQREDRGEFLALSRDSRELHLPWAHPPTTPRDFADLLARSEREDFVSLLVCRARDGAIAGVCNLSQIFRGAFQNAYLGYYASAKLAGRGYMTEGMQLVLHHAFCVLGLHRVEANIQPGNAASLALARRAGFKREGFSPRYLQIGGEWRDHERWAILAEDWLARVRAAQDGGGGV